MTAASLPLPASAPRPAAAPAAARGSWLIGAVMIITLYYLSYRYPFRISDSGTSPTYADTPTWLQLGKYALLAPLLGYGIFRSRLRSGMIAVVDVAVAVLVGYGFLIGMTEVAGGEPLGLRLVQLSFALSFFVLFSEPLVTGAYFDQVIRAFRIFFTLTLATYAIHLGLYFTTGRLPALGYYGIFPRFGGIWDDPNSAAAIFTFMVPYLLARDGLTRTTAILGLASFAAVLLSQSLTTFGVVALTFVVVLPLFYRSVPLATRLVIVFLTLLLVAVVFAVIAVLVLQSLDLTVGGVIRSMDQILRSKSESVLMREQSYSFVSRIDAMTLLGLSPLGRYGENQIVNLLANGGLLYTLGMLGLQVTTLFQLWQWSKVASRAVRPAVIGLFCFYLWFVLMQVNIPSSEIFPINILSAIVAGMAWAWRGSAGQARAAVRTRAAAGF